MLNAAMIGATGEQELIVTEEHSAVRWGSGGVDVLSTPQMIALMESAAVAAVDPYLEEGWRTVGIHLDVAHLAATPMGSRVTARAELIAIEGRKLTFRVEAFDEAGKIGEGTHQRFLVDVERFMNKARERVRRA
ncbi:MAG: thioesterase family protein [Chloroflexi bacterium]|nr:thioesterase family protein [Chloroflexota bacterium]